MTKKQLREEISELRRVGQTLSNIAYNLGQNLGYTLDSHVRNKLKSLQIEWDKIPRSKPILPNPTPVPAKAEIRTARV